MFDNLSLIWVLQKLDNIICNLREIWTNLENPALQSFCHCVKKKNYNTVAQAAAEY